MEFFVPDFARKRPRSRTVCTLGPASSSPEIIGELVEAGMSVARINTAHSSLETHSDCIQTVREVSKAKKVPVGILVDLPGPKYRLGNLEGNGVELDAGDMVTLLSGNGRQTDTARSAKVMPEGLHRDVSVDDEILVADGAIMLTATAVSTDGVECTARNAGRLESRKTVAIPGRTSSLHYLAGDTTEALDFALAQDVDFIGLSYVRGAADLATTREYIADRRPSVQLIAKIELRDAVQNLDEILAASDGVMVARGDLGVELPVAQVPGVQKRIIRKANQVGKVVITATQMLESMITAPTPTRAEVTDVANAVLDGTDAVMLSAETSIGQHPVEATRVMAEAAREAEHLLDHDQILARRSVEIGHTVDDAIAYAACWTAANLGAQVILAFTESGSTAARVAAFRPAAPILALSRDSAAARRLSLRWGITALPHPLVSSIQWMFREGSRAAIESGFAAEGDLAIAVAGLPLGIKGNTNLLRVIRLPEPEPLFQRGLIDDAIRQPG